MSETTDQSPADKIMQTYWDLFLEEQISLERFCQRLAGGEFGPYSKDQITDFLRQVEHRHHAGGQSPPGAPAG